MRLQAASARRVLHLCVVSILSCACSVFDVQAARHPHPLEIITNRADVASRTNPRSAIANYYEPKIDSADFASAGAALQERFLFEYLQACNRAAQRTPGVARRYRKMAVTVATRYIEWFGQVEQREWTSRLPAIRIAAVVKDLGSARVLTGDRDDLIDDYETIPIEKAYYFNRESLKLWEDSLRAYPDFRAFYDDKTIRRRVATDPTHRVHWDAFRAVLERLRTGGPSRNYARVRLVALDQLLSQ